MKRQKPKKVYRPFKQIPFPKWPETWKCNCGGMTSEIFCNNCGKSKYMVRADRKKKNQQEFLDALNLLVEELV